MRGDIVQKSVNKQTRYFSTTKSKIQYYNKEDPGGVLAVVEVKLYFIVCQEDLPEDMMIVLRFNSRRESATRRFRGTAFRQMQ